MPTPPPVTPPESGSSGTGNARIGPGKSAHVTLNNIREEIGRAVDPYPPAFWAILNVSASVTLEAAWTYVRVDATSSAVTVTLPSASQYVGQMVAVSKVDTGINAVNIAAYSGDTLYFGVTSVIDQYDSAYMIAVVDGSGGYGWQRVEYGGGLNLTQVRVVSEAPGTYTSIQDAIDSITDADATKPYTVWVCPGVYSEQVTMVPFVTIRGIDRDAVFVSFTGNDNGTFIGANDSSISDLTVVLSDEYTEWGVVVTNPENFTLNNVSIRGTTDYAYTGGCFKATGTGNKLTIDSCRLMGGDNTTPADCIYIDLAALDPEDQEVVIKNTRVFLTNDAARAIYLGQVNNADIIASFIFGSIELDQCPYTVGITGSTTGTVSVNVDSPENTTLLLAGSIIEGGLTTSGTGSVFIHGHYSTKVAGGSSRIPFYTTSGVATPPATKTTTYTALYSDEVLLGDATGGAFTITLPTAVGNEGKPFTVKRINSGANAVTIGTTSSETIDGSTTVALSSQYAFRSVISDGTNWVVVGTG